MAHVYDGPADNRKSFAEVQKALDAADSSYTEAQRRGPGGGPPPVGKDGAMATAAAVAAASAVAAAASAGPEVARPTDASKDLISILKRHGKAIGAGAGLPDSAAAAAAAVAAARGGAGGQNPRGAVSEFFKALGGYIMKTRLTLRDVARKFDSDQDGYLDTVDLRYMVRGIMPEVTEAQAVYVKVRGWAWVLFFRAE